MPPKRFFSDVESQEIQQYLRENPMTPMKAVAKKFNLSYKTFRKLAYEMNMWAPKPYAFEKKSLPINLVNEIQTIYQENSENIRAAYQIFFDKYGGNPPCKEKRFRNICQTFSLKVSRTSSKFFSSADFVTVFERKSPIPKRTLGRAFRNLLASSPSQEFLLELDPSLNEEILFRYQKIQTLGCWTCGKTEHFGLPVPLEIDHINGQNRDNRLGNLRLICCSCHALTKTYSRNKKKDEKSVKNKTSYDLYANFQEKIDIAMMKKAFVSRTKAIGEEKEKNFRNLLL